MRTDCSGAASNGSLCSRVEVIHRDGAHEGELKVRMRIDAAWHHEAIGCINNASFTRLGPRNDHRVTFSVG